MKALTLWQPWAQLIALGAKTVETRGWATRYRGPLVIHAARAYGPGGRGGAELLVDDTRSIERVLIAGGYSTTEHGREYADVAALPRAAVVAVCWLDEVLPTEQLRATHADQADFCDYSDGRSGWLLSGGKTLAEPLEWKGAQGLWNVPAELHRALLAAGVPCPRDTDGDGDCGRSLCPYCGPGAWAEVSGAPGEAGWTS